MKPLHEHLLRQAGAISTAQARASGLSRRQIEHKLSTGEWLPAGRGVYRLAAAVPLPELGLWTALLALGPDALLLGEGAVWWWGVATEPPSCWTFLARSVRRSGSNVRVSRAFVDRRDQHRHRGVRVVSRPWAVLTTAAVWERREAGRGIALIDRAKQLRAVRQHDLDGRSSVIRAAGAAPPSGSCSRGPATERTPSSERLAVSLLRGAGITGFHPNLTVRLQDGTSAEIDIAFPDRRVAIELDGYAFHSGAESFRRDVRRGNRLLAAGWTVRRFPRTTSCTTPTGLSPRCSNFCCVDHP